VSEAVMGKGAEAVIPHVALVIAGLR
jgi:hypothetical protein